MLIAGGSLSVGFHDPDRGTLMPLGAAHLFSDAHLILSLDHMVYVEKA